MTTKSGKSRPGVVPPPESAAGPPAIAEVLRQISSKTGVLKGVSGLLKMNQPGGFDCPGCAWPEESEHRKRAEFCENGAKAFADEATRARIGADFFKEHSLADLALKSGQWLNEQGRLTQPMVKRPGATHYTAITWFSALELIARQLNSLDDPNQAAFYTSGRTSNEAAFMWQLFVRAYGTNNMPDCSNLCHESSGTALIQAIGSGKGTVRLSDFDEADAIFVLGQNPGSNHPRMLATLERAKKRGAVIVSVNPLDETGLKKFRNPQTVAGWVGKGTALTDLHVPVKINGDVAFLKGVCRAMLEAEAVKPGAIIDRAFIQQHTSSFEEFAADILATSWEEIEQGSGVDRQLIEQAAGIAMNARNTICCWAMGLTQHRNAVANIQSVVNFLLLKGNFGRPGAGACPVRGHSNVQGDRTMGIWEKPTADFLERLGKRFGFDPPTAHGFDTVDTLLAMDQGKVKVLLALGGNFAAASPDSEFTERALKKCSLTVQVSTKLNRSHVATGETALILPVLGRTEVDRQGTGEQFVTVENSMGMVTQSRGHLQPPGNNLRSEIRLIAELADATLGTRSTIRWRELSDDYHLIRDDIARVVPGFADFNNRLYDEKEIELPHAVRDKLRFDTSNGKAQFSVNPITTQSADAGQFVMTTIRSHDQFNTTVYSQNDRYRGISNSRHVVFMNAEDIKAAGFQAGSQVTIRSSLDGVDRQLEGFTVVEYRIPRGCVATYYPESNPLVPIAAVAEHSNTPAYKSIVVTINPD